MADTTNKALDTLNGAPAIGNWVKDHFTQKGHKHTKSEITDFPASLKNPTFLKIKINGEEALSYDGSIGKEVDITLKGLGLDLEAGGNAKKLTNARTITLTGDVSGNFTFDGSTDVSFETVVADNSHKHVWTNITDRPSTLPNPKSLKIQIAGGTTEDTNQFTYDGTTAKTLNITKASIGLSNVSNKADSDRSVKEAGRLTTARTLKYVGDATGSISFDGSKDVEVNLDVNHAAQLDVARTITLTGDATGNFTYDGSKDVSFAVDVNHAARLDNARTITIAGGATGSATFDGSRDITIDLSNIDVTRLKGVISPDNLPKDAFDVVKPVTDDTARFKLTTDDVQKGDTVKVLSTGLMYLVTDTTKLDSESGYEVYAAGTAAEADKLSKSRTFTFTGDATGSSTFDGANDFSVVLDVKSSAKLDSAYKINGTGFDGTKDITTDNWGTARNISIADSSQTNTGTAVSVNGSKAYTLLLPATIKAAITGHASEDLALTGGTVTGATTFSKTAGFTYTGIEKATANASRNVWFSDSAAVGRPVYNDNFKYNPSTNVLTVGSISGSAAKLTTGRKITLSGDTAGSATFDGSSDQTITTVTSSVMNTGGRRESADIKYGDGKLRYMLATSSMTTGKPPWDSHILHMAWDNQGGWDSELAQNDVDGQLAVRGENGGTWTSWNKVYDTGHKPALTDLSGTLAVAHGGTGKTSLDSGKALIGNGTNAVNFRTIKDYTTVQALGWTSGDTSLIDSNSIAYWNGAYTGTSSNLSYTAVGKLGNVATVNKNSNTSQWLNGNGAWTTPTPAQIGALAKAGDTATGKMYFEQGHSTKTLANGSGTAGYMNACTIKITNNYQNQPLVFTVVQRGYRYGIILVSFANANSTDPALGSFTTTGDVTAYIVKASTSTWTLYIQKSEAYDSIEVVDLERGAYNSCTITWNNSTVTSLPSGYTQATKQVWSGNATSATKLQTARKIELTGDATGSATFDGTKDIQIKTLINNFSGSSASKDGTSGLVPAPTKGTEDYFLQASGTWASITSIVAGTKVQDASYADKAGILSSLHKFTVGATTKEFNGSQDVSWTLDEIGAAAKVHTHDDRYFTETEINTFAYKDNRNDNVNATTDFNTLTSAGSYKVQMSAWGNADTYHSPNKLSSSIYSFGILFVAKSSNSDSEHRIIQIYMPHGKGANTWCARWHNGNNVATASQWSSWTWVSQDTNTWRGIQNNLTSTSTTDSLSAAQGKALNDKFASYLPLAGGTMTGQLKTSFKSSVAVGSYAASSTTIENLCNELRYSSGVMGSVSIGTAYTLNNVTVGTGWYNFLWIPHRSGGVNGSASGDNCNYGTLFLVGMTVTNVAYILQYQSSAIKTLFSIRDTNTWRGVQNNLTSTSTTDSLSAAQGKALNDKFGSYLPLSGGTMTGQIQKAGAGSSWVAGRSNSMIRQNSYTGYNPIISAKTTNGSWELGPYTSDILHLSYITDTNFNAGTNSQTVDIQFGTDSSITAKTFKGALSGNATTATTLQTARTINGTSFNGSANITTANWGTARNLTVGNQTKSVNGSANISWPNPLKIYYYGSDTASTSGWYKMCTVTQKGYNDCNLNLLITSGYSRQASGLLHVHVRCDNGTANSIKSLKWMYRYGFSAGDVYFKDNGSNTWSLYVYQQNAQYGRVQVQILTETGTSASQWDMQWSNNATKESATPTGGTAATDGATVNYANSAGSVAWSSVTGKPNRAGSSSDGGSATSAVKLDSNAGSATQPIYFSGGKPVATTYALNKTVPSDAKFTDTTYPITYKTIDGSYKTKARTETKGNTNSGDFISIIRNDTASVDSSPQYGSGLMTGRSDTHMYLYTSYSADGFYVGGGNADKLNWVSRVYTSNHKPSKSDVGLGNVDNTADSTKTVSKANQLTTARNFTIGDTKKSFNGTADVSWTLAEIGASKVKTAAITLTASNWSGTAAPYTYDLGSTYASGACAVGFNSATGTTAQLEAAQNANIQGSNGTKLYAYGEKPTVDIPIVVEYT